MTTSEDVRDTALRLAAEDLPEEEAVRQLLACCADHRAAVVTAKWRLTEEPENPASGRALELVDRVLELDVWTS